MLRAAVFFLALECALAQGPPQACTPMDVAQPIPGSPNAISGNMFVPMMLQGFEGMLASTIRSNDDLSGFIASKSQCQMDCVANTSRLALETMWGMGRFSPEHSNREQAEQDITQALVGAIRACYPGAPREGIVHTVQAVLSHTPAGAPVTMSDIDLGGSCSDMISSPGRAEFLSTFEEEIGPAVEQAMHSSSAIAHMFMNGKMCQSHCVETAVSQGVRTLWDSGNIAQSDGDEYARAALTGAIKACYPRGTQADVEEFSNQIVTNIKSAVAEAHHAATRLYLSQNKLSKMTGTPAPVLFAFAAGLLAFFALGVTAGRRCSKESSAREPETTGRSPLVEDELE